MEEKLRKLMKHEGLNSTRLAEILGIQASGISHIMSGRNKPSFDFLIKLLQRFPQINPDWLLLDKGPMYRDEIKGKVPASPQVAATPFSIENEMGSRTDDLFSAKPLSHEPSLPQYQSLGRDDNDIIPKDEVQTPLSVSSLPRNLAHASSIERIVVFYKDKTFTEYQPG